MGRPFWTVSLFQERFPLEDFPFTHELEIIGINQKEEFKPYAIRKKVEVVPYDQDDEEKKHFHCRFIWDEDQIKRYQIKKKLLCSEFVVEG